METSLSGRDEHLINDRGCLGGLLIFSEPARKQKKEKREDRRRRERRRKIFVPGLETVNAGRGTAGEVFEKG